jgi:hypothetical protein
MVVIQEQKVNPKLAIVAPYENGLGFTIFMTEHYKKTQFFRKAT